MIAVSNSSPIMNLAAIGRLNLIKLRFGNVIIPDAVWREKGEGELSDERILGSSDFVAKIIQQSQGSNKKIPPGFPTLPDLIRKVTHHMALSQSALLSRSRDSTVSRAQGLLFLFSLLKTQTEIKKHLNISRTGVRNCILRGEKMVDKCQKRYGKRSSKLR